MLNVAVTRIDDGDLAVFIGKSECFPVSEEPSTNDVVECYLPAGTGFDLEVIVQSTMCPHPATTTLLSYAKPDVEKISGCSDSMLINPMAPTVNHFPFGDQLNGV